MSDTGFINPYDGSNPLSSPEAFAGWLASKTETGFNAFFGRPSPDAIQAGKDQLGASMARAGASPAEQQSAAAQYEKQIAAASKTFDKNHPASTIAQRAFDAAMGTTDPADVIDWSWLVDPSSQSFDWKSIAIVGLVIFIVFLILKEVL